MRRGMAAVFAGRLSLAHAPRHASLTSRGLTLSIIRVERRNPPRCPTCHPLPMPTAAPRVRGAPGRILLRDRPILNVPSLSLILAAAVAIAGTPSVRSAPHSSQTDAFGIAKIYADAPAPANNWIFGGKEEDPRFMEQRIVEAGDGWFRPRNPTEM